MVQVYKGSCLCGKITFQVSGFSQQAANCHCSMCRKFHGAAFATLVGVTGLKWLSGESFLKEFIAPNRTIRTFCEACGSSIGFRVENEPREAMEIAIAAFDADIPVEIAAHIYTNYKVCWHEINDDLEKFGEGRVSCSS